MPTDIDGFSGFDDEAFNRVLNGENPNFLARLIKEDAPAFWNAFILLQTESLNLVVDQIASKKEYLAQFSEGLKFLPVEKIDSVLGHLGQAGSFSQNKIQVVALVIRAKSIKTGQTTFDIVMENKIKSLLGLGIVLGIFLAVLQERGLQNLPEESLVNSDPAASVAMKTVTAVAKLLPEKKLLQPEATVAIEPPVPVRNVPAVITSSPFVDNPPMGAGGKSATILASPEGIDVPPFDFLAEDAVHAVKFPVKPAVSGVASFVKDNSEGGASLSENSLSSIATKFDTIPGEERVPLFADLTPQEIGNLSLIKEVLDEGGAVVISMFQSLGARSGYGTKIDGISGPETLAHALATILVCNKDFEEFCESMNYYEEITGDSKQWDPLAVYLRKNYGRHIKNLPSTIGSKAELESTLVKVIKFATTTNDESVPYFVFNEALVSKLKFILAGKGVENIAVDASEIQTTAPEAPSVPSFQTETSGVSEMPDQALKLAKISAEIPAAPTALEALDIDTTSAVAPIEVVSKAVVAEEVVPATVETVVDGGDTIDVITQMNKLTNGQAYVLNPDGSLNIERGPLNVMVNGSSNFNTSVNLEPGSQVVIRVEQGGTVYFVGYEIRALPNGGVDIDTATQEVIHQQ